MSSQGILDSCRAYKHASGARLTPLVSWVIHKQGEKKLIKVVKDTVKLSIYDILKPDDRDERILTAKKIDSERVLERLFYLWLDEAQDRGGYPSGRSVFMDEFLDSLTQDVTDGDFDTYDDLKGEKKSHPLVRLIESKVGTMPMAEVLQQLSTKFGSQASVKEELMARFVNLLEDDTETNTSKRMLYQFPATKKYAKHVEGMVNS